MFFSKKKISSAGFNKARFARFLIWGTVMGIAISMGEPLIFGGVLVTDDRFDFAFELELKKKSDAICTGSLVHPQLILTAAHCLNDSDGAWTTVRFAQNGNQTNKKWFKGLKVFANDWNYHPKYVNPTQYSNEQQIYQSRNWDIGYVLLSEPVDAEYVTPVPIKLLNDQENPKKVTVVGYGHTYKNQKNFSRTKNKVDLEITSIAYPSHFTVENDEEGVLHGDSGAPVLVADEKKNFSQVAITHGYAHNTSTGQYHHSVYTLLTAEKLCWVEKDSGIDIAGVDCK